MGGLFAVPELRDQQLPSLPPSSYNEYLSAAIGGSFVGATKVSEKFAAARHLLAKYSLGNTRWDVLEAVFVSALAVGRVDVATTVLGELVGRFGPDARRVALHRAAHSAVTCDNVQAAEAIVHSVVAAVPADVQAALSFLSLSSSAHDRALPASHDITAASVEGAAAIIITYFATDPEACRAAARALLALRTPKVAAATAAYETALMGDPRDPFTLVDLADSLTAERTSTCDEKARLYYITAVELVLPGVDVRLMKERETGCRGYAQSRLPYGAVLRRALFGILHVTGAMEGKVKKGKGTDARTERLVEWASGHLACALPAGSPVRARVEKIMD